MLAGLEPLPFLNVKAEPVQQKRIEQIDIIWAQAVYEIPRSPNPGETACH
ncbi:unnamed protein product [marine sediment metagenome]|uniref:Uncharacterized protein n=1 Tax=marine sediment metagenome TaxID=412755 RepID=X1L0S1_9ZZZZ